MQSPALSFSKTIGPKKFRQDGGVRNSDQGDILVHQLLTKAKVCTQVCLHQYVIPSPKTLEFKYSPNCVNLRAIHIEWPVLLFWRILHISSPTCRWWEYVQNSVRHFLKSENSTFINADCERAII